MSALAGAPPFILLGAALPVAGFTALLLWIARGWHERHRRLLVAFLWGVLVAPALSAYANDLLLARAPVLTPVLLAPLVEELAKAAVLGLLLLSSADDGIRTGLVCGALTGLGFSLTENVGYLTLAAIQDGPGGVWRAIWLRGIVGGAKHPVFTATTGAAFGRARAMPAGAARTGLAIAGLGGAVLQHAVWNGVASRAITGVMCHAASAGGPCQGPDTVDLLVRIPPLILACLAPGLLGLAVVARRAGRAAVAGLPSS